MLRIESRDARGRELPHSGTIVAPACIMYYSTPFQIMKDSIRNMGGWPYYQIISYNKRANNLFRGLKIGGGAKGNKIIGP